MSSEEEGILPSGGFRLQIAMSTLPCIPSLLACPADFGLANSHSHVGPFLKIN